MQAESDTTVSVVAGEGDGTLGTGSVVLISTSGTTVSQTGGWTYVARGVISSVAPSQGQVGTWVTISGSRLLGAGNSIVQVQLGGVAVATISNYSNSSVVVRAASSNTAGLGSAVLTADTGAVVSLANSWTYLTTGLVVATTPNQGQVGTRVVLTGQRLLGGGSGLSSVTFGNVSCTIVYANDSGTGAMAMRM